MRRASSTISARISATGLISRTRPMAWEQAIDAALDQAIVNLERTDVLAPDDGVVTDVRVDRGNFAQAGAPLMTFLATKDVWIQADFTENNLGNIKPGDPVGIVFDALPGKVIKGTVRTTGFGVQVDSAPLGSLPTISNDRQWLRDSQRFSVLVDFELPNAEDRRGIRVGAQASVIAYNEGEPFSCQKVTVTPDAFSYKCKNYDFIVAINPPVPASPPWYYKKYKKRYRKKRRG